MDNPPQSIYPDFFRLGLHKLQGQGFSSNDLLGLFTALQHFQRDLREKETVADILEVTRHYLAGLDLFAGMAFYLIHPDSLAFELAGGVADENRAAWERLVQAEIRSGKFAWALRQSGPAVFETHLGSSPARGLFHPLTMSTHTVGMFCGLLQSTRVARQEIGLSLLSILLGACADALAVARQSAELKNKILTVHQDLQRALAENGILARLPAESPAPIIRLDRDGRILYANAAGTRLLARQGRQPGDLVVGEWRAVLEAVFRTGENQEFEAPFGEQVYAFVAVAIREAGYANFYGTDISARQQAEQARQRVIVELQEALQRVRTLSGLLPICATCKKIRDDRGYWNSVEVYIQHHTQATFSHGICPDCIRKFYPEIAEQFFAEQAAKEQRVAQKRGEGGDK